MSDILLVEPAADGVVWVTLNRPDARNALSRELNLELIQVAERLGKDEAVRVIVLTGVGEQAFCAGADLKERKGVSAADSGPFISAISGAVEAWANIPQPTIAAMNGAAYGGGLELALACDLRILVDTAEVGLTEVRLGIMPGAGGTQRLPRLIGEAHAKELILLGRRINAARAMQIGVVNAIVPAAELKQAVGQWLIEIGGCAPLSVKQAKRAIEQGLDTSVAGGLVIERQCYDVTLFSEDRNEGLRAFAERRPPRFQGK
jgi:enoyl-CoA hydratase/carnithine racemase